MHEKLGLFNPIRSARNIIGAFSSGVVGLPGGDQRAGSH